VQLRRPSAYCMLAHALWDCCPPRLLKPSEVPTGSCLLMLKQGAQKVEKWSDADLDERQGLPANSTRNVCAGDGGRRYNCSI
jgi:hypothetical protein